MSTEWGGSLPGGFRLCRNDVAGRGADRVGPGGRGQGPVGPVGRASPSPLVLRMRGERGAIAAAAGADGVNGAGRGADWVGTGMSA